jgi:hypothetical protein
MRKSLLPPASAEQRAPSSHGSSLRALFARVSLGKEAPAHDAPSPATTRQTAVLALVMFAAGVQHGSTDPRNRVVSALDALPSLG